MTRVPYKVRLVRRYGVFLRAPRQVLRYVVYGRELDNFTYELANEGELARFLSDGLQVSVDDATRYIGELQEDVELRTAIESRLAERNDRNPTMPYGRRLGWYAIVRAMKPEVVVETGVHDGLGSAVLLRALERNADDGHFGTLVSFDVNADAGWLIPEFAKSRHELVLGPAPDGFAAALGGRRVGFFIHDSDHRYEHETAEFEAILPVCVSGAVLASDNAHGGTAFADFCERRGLDFRFFHEAPRDHWYPGAGIGMASLDWLRSTRQAESA